MGPWITVAALLGAWWAVRRYGPREADVPSRSGTPGTVGRPIEVHISRDSVCSAEDQQPGIPFREVRTFPSGTSLRQILASVLDSNYLGLYGGRASWGAMSSAKRVARLSPPCDAWVLVADAEDIAAAELAREAALHIHFVFYSSG